MWQLFPDAVGAGGDGLREDEGDGGTEREDETREDEDEAAGERRWKQVREKPRRRRLGHGRAGSGLGGWAGKLGWAARRLGPYQKWGSNLWAPNFSNFHGP